MSNGAAPGLDVLVKGVGIPALDVIGWVVERDLDQPGMCVVTLRNADREYSEKQTLGASVEIKADGSPGPADVPPDRVGTIFKGELVGIEPVHAQGESRCALRACDRLHRLQRGRKSRVYEDQTDADICSAIAAQHGLSAQTGSTPGIRHTQIYQHNQTDLEFIRTLAGRIGRVIWCEDTTLLVVAPRLEVDSGLTFTVGASGKAGLASFTARMSNLSVTKKVTVRGWNPDRTEEFVGEASPARSPLGALNAAASLKDFPGLDSFTVDHPIFSVEEANAMARGAIEEAGLTFLSAEAVAPGDPRIKPGIVVRVEGADDRFNGRYFVQGCTHQFDPGPSGAPGGYVTIMRLVRNAEKG